MPLTELRPLTKGEREEGESEGGREGGREEEREGERKRGREREKERERGGREGERKIILLGRNLEEKRACLLVHPQTI